MARKRILLAGAGRWGKVYLRNLERHPRLMAAGLVTSQNRPAVPHLEAETTLFSSLSEALRKGGWHGVILATPPETHAQQLQACLAENLPVLVEKPLTLAAHEAINIAKLPGAASVLVDHIFLFHPGYMKLKELLARAGPIKSIFSEGENTGPFRPYSPLWDYGAHDLSMILDLLGTDPTSIKACVKDAGRRDGGLAGDYSVSLDFRCGANARFRASNVSSTKVRRIAVETQHARFVLDDTPTPRLTRACLPDGREEEINLPEGSPLQGLLETFSDGLDGKRDPRWGLELGTRVVESLESCDRALAHA